MQTYEESESALYQARVNGEASRIRLDGKDNDTPVAWHGEILVTGWPREGQLVFEEVRRLSGWTDRVDELDGPIAFAGATTLDRPTLRGETPLDIRLYYSLLGKEKPACEETDAIYPQIEVIRGALEWQPGERQDDLAELEAIVTLRLTELVDPILGQVRHIQLGPTPLTFRRLEDDLQEQWVANSLVPCTSSPLPAPASPPSAIHDQRALAVRFVSLSTSSTPAALAALEVVAKALIEGACEVWWQKGGIKIVPEPAITAPNNTLHGMVTVSQEASLKTLVANSDDPNTVEIYLVDTLPGDLAINAPRTHGGVTHYCGTFDAYVILEIGKARFNKYLLAHELGHVLGLTHPATAVGGGACNNFPPGSECSVMVPDGPTSSRNTENNLSVSPFPTGAPFTTLSVGGVPLKCGWAPNALQGFFHYIRDFPYDDGTEASTPQPPVTNWWSKSDIWNSNLAPSVVDRNNKYDTGTPMFAPDSTPMHVEPTTVGPNHMYVRLHTCQAFEAATDVHLFLAVPGDPAAPLTRLTAVAGSGTTNPLAFSGTAKPNPGDPKTLRLRWQIPSGYPSHCCIFAVANSLSESATTQTVAARAIISSPATHRFYHLFQQLKTNNNVVQRNLHIQTIARSAGTLRTTLLPWLALSNPLEDPADLRLEIDTSLAAGLNELRLEVNGRLGEPLPREERFTVTLAENLQPDTRLITRLQATVSPGVPENARLSIDLFLFAGNELVNGYTHVVQVGTPASAMGQAVDLLFGALRDAADAFNSAEARQLADSIAGIAETFLLVHLPLVDAAQAAFTRLEPRPASVAASMRAEPVDVEALEVVQAMLLELDVLFAQLPANPDDFPEALRALGDRIQEPACRVLRRRDVGA